MTPTNNYRWSGYLFIALGLINWRYQSSNPNATFNSLILVGAGLATLALSWSKQGLALLNSQAGKIVGPVIAIALIVFAIVN
jgi:hypothetical protein